MEVPSLLYSRALSFLEEMFRITPLFPEAMSFAKAWVGIRDSRKSFRLTHSFPSSAVFYSKPFLPFSFICDTITYIFFSEDVMKKKLSPILALVLVVLAIFFAVPNSTEAPDSSLPPESLSNATVTGESTDASADVLDPDGSYTSKEDVALYIHTYGCLPGNFITKSQAQDLGWTSGGLEDYAPGKCIGGDRFGNYEGLLPAADGRSWTECDIDTLGASSRGAKRIVFSNDGLIYYTEDHYETFELLYEEP